MAYLPLEFDGVGRFLIKDMGLYFGRSTALLVLIGRTFRCRISGLPSVDIFALTAATSQPFNKKINLPPTMRLRESDTQVNNFCYLKLAGHVKRAIFRQK